MKFFSKKKIIPILVGIICLFANLGFATEQYWVDGNGDFTNGAKWVSGTPPGVGDSAVFTNLPSNAIVTFSSTVTNNLAIVDTTNVVTFTVPSGQRWAITNDAGTSPAATFAIGTGLTTRVVITGGGNLSVEDGSANTGTYQLGIGQTSSGTLTISNITYTLKRFTIGIGAGSANSSLFLSNCAGTHVRVFRSMAIGNGQISNISNCLVRISNSKLTIGDIVVGETQVGGNNNGLIIENGTSLTNTTMSVGANANVQTATPPTNSYCVITGSGTFVTNSTSIQVANISSSSGSATRPAIKNRLLITSNSIVRTPSLSVGRAIPGVVASAGGISATNDIIIDNGAACYVAGDVMIGYTTQQLCFAANNQLSVNSSGILTCSNLTIGAETNTSRSSNIVNSGSIYVWNTASVGDNGAVSNFLHVLGSGAFYTTNLIVGSNQVEKTANGITLWGGNLHITNNSSSAALDIRNGGLLITNGTLICDNFILTNNAPSYTNATFTQSGGSFYIRNSKVYTASNNTFLISGNARMYFNGGTSVVDSVYNVGGRFGSAGPNSGVIIYGAGTVVSNLTTGRGYGGAGSHVVCSNGAFLYHAQGFQIGLANQYGRMTVTDAGSIIRSAGSASYCGVGSGEGGGLVEARKGGVLDCYGINYVCGYNDSSNCWTIASDPGSLLIMTNGLTVGLRGRKSVLSVTNGAVALTKTANVGTVDTNATYGNLLYVNNSYLTNSGLVTVGSGGWGNEIRLDSNARFIQSSTDNLQIGGTAPLTQGEGTNSVTINGGSIATNFNYITISNSQGNSIALLDSGQLHAVGLRMISQNNSITLSGRSLLSFSDGAILTGSSNNIIKITGNSKMVCNNLKIQ